MNSNVLRDTRYPLKNVLDILLALTAAIPRPGGYVLAGSLK